MHQPESSIFRN